MLIITPIDPHDKHLHSDVPTEILREDVNNASYYPTNTMILDHSSMGEGGRYI